jgi:hypothetical protein
MRLKHIASAALLSPLLSLGIVQSVYAQCTYMGGYPFKDGGCLIAKDLNAAIAGRNPLLDYPVRTGQAIVGFDGGVPVFGAVSGSATALKSGPGPGTPVCVDNATGQMYTATGAAC